GVLDRALLDLGHLGGDPDHDPRPHQRRAVVSAVDEVRQHLLGDLEVGDHAVLHRTDRDDVAGGAAQHVLGVAADGFDLAGDAVDRHDRRLRDHDALALRVDERVPGPAVYREIARPDAQAPDGTKIHGAAVL